MPYHIDAKAGDEIATTISQAISEAAAIDDLVDFNFNGVTVTVAHDSDADLIYRDWMRAMNGCIQDKRVGPYPAANLSTEEQESDRRINVERAVKAAVRQREAETEVASAKAKLDSALSSAPPASWIDDDAWKKWTDNNTDPYGRRIVQYAEDWARLMQARMSAGESLAECAEPCSRLADHDGITGFMYGAAVQVLSTCWEHGDRLRRWHNADKANESGGILNPAIIKIGK